VAHGKPKLFSLLKKTGNECHRDEGYFV